MIKALGAQVLIDEDLEVDPIDEDGGEGFIGIALGEHAYVEQNYQFSLHLVDSDPSEPQLTTVLSVVEYNVLQKIIARLVRSPVSMH